MGAGILIRTRTKGNAGKEYICMVNGNSGVPQGSIQHSFPYTSVIN